MSGRLRTAICAGALLLSLAAPQVLVAQEPPASEETAGAPSELQVAAAPGATDAPSPASSPADDAPTPAPPSSYAQPEAPVATAAGSATVTMADFSFTPATVSVGVGDTVTWVNNGPDEDHTATANDGSFDTGELGVGSSGSHTFTQPGSFPYVCSLHPDDMKGTVQVTGSSDGSETATGSADPTGPGSEAAAGTAPDSADDSGLPASGLELWHLALAAAALLLSGAVIRRSPAR